MSDPSCLEQVESVNIHLDTEEDDGYLNLLAEKGVGPVEYGESSDGGSSSNVHQALETASLGDGSGSSEGLARGIATLMTGVIRDFDMKAETVSNSQDQLFYGLDRLTKELDKLLEDPPVQFSIHHAARIFGIRKRVSSMNMTLTSIQRRMDYTYHMLPLKSRHELGPLRPTNAK